MNVRLFLIFIFGLFVHSVLTKQPKRCRLTKLEKLHFTKHPNPSDDCHQPLKCVDNGLCKHYEAETIDCFNEGVNKNGGVKWNCKYDTLYGNRYVVLNASHITCSRPSDREFDDEIFECSCQLKYTLQTVDQDLYSFETINFDGKECNKKCKKGCSLKCVEADVHIKRLCEVYEIETISCHHVILKDKKVKWSCSSVDLPSNVEIVNPKVICGKIKKSCKLSYSYDIIDQDFSSLEPIPHIDIPSKCNKIIDEDVIIDYDIVPEDDIITVSDCHNSDCDIIDEDEIIDYDVVPEVKIISEKVTHKVCHDYPYCEIEDKDIIYDYDTFSEVHTITDYDTTHDCHKSGDCHFKDVDEIIDYDTFKRIDTVPEIEPYHVEDYDTIVDDDLIIDYDKTTHTLHENDCQDLLDCTVIIDEDKVIDYDQNIDTIPEKVPHLESIPHCDEGNCETIIDEDEVLDFDIESETLSHDDTDCYDSETDTRLCDLYTFEEVTCRYFVYAKKWNCYSKDLPPNVKIVKPEVVCKQVHKCKLRYTYDIEDETQKPDEIITEYKEYDHYVPDEDSEHHEITDFDTVRDCAKTKTCHHKYHDEHFDEIVPDDHHVEDIIEEKTEVIPDDHHDEIKEVKKDCTKKKSCHHKYHDEIIPEEHHHEHHDEFHIEDVDIIEEKTEVIPDDHHEITDFDTVGDCTKTKTCHHEYHDEIIPEEHHDEVIPDDHHIEDIDIIEEQTEIVPDDHYDEYHDEYHNEHHDEIIPDDHHIEDVDIIEEQTEVIPDDHHDCTKTKTCHHEYHDEIIPEEYNIEDIDIVEDHEQPIEEHEDAIPYVEYVPEALSDCDEFSDKGCVHHIDTYTFKTNKKKEDYENIVEQFECKGNSKQCEEYELEVVNCRPIILKKKIEWSCSSPDLPSYVEIEEPKVLCKKKNKKCKLCYSVKIINEKLPRVETFTFETNERTSVNKPIEQSNCEGELCDHYDVEKIDCKNLILYKQSKCQCTSPDLPPEVKIVHSKIICDESHSNSCSLDYTIKTIEDSKCESTHCDDVLTFERNNIKEISKTINHSDCIEATSSGDFCEHFELDIVNCYYEILEDNAIEWKCPSPDLPPWVHIINPEITCGEVDPDSCSLIYSLES